MNVTAIQARRHSSLRRSVAGVIKSGLAAPWIWRYLLREWSVHDILVLTYHRVGAADTGAPITSEQFASQMDWLVERCDIIAPEVLPDFFAGRMTPRRPSVCLTFDDGHRCLHDVVYPILRQRNLRAIAFLATGPITNEAYVWPDDIRQRLLVTDRESLTLPFLGEQRLLDKHQRMIVAGQIISELKRRPDEERRAVIDVMQQSITLPLERSPMMSWVEAANMGDVFHWGAHTHTHPVLSRVSVDIARDEIRKSRQTIVENTGQAVDLFAYPNGTRDDYTDEVKAVLRNEGFMAAFTTNTGFVSRSDDLFALNRCPTTAPHLSDFAWITARPSWAA